MKFTLVSICTVVIVGTIAGAPEAQEELLGKTSIERAVRNQIVTKVTPVQDARLYKIDQSSRKYIRIEIPTLKRIVYFHRRKIGEAIVEKDFIRYRLDSDSGNLVEETKQWREGLPDTVVPIITRDDAEDMVDGEILSSYLYIISPESEIFHIEPTPTNPCWVVRSNLRDRKIITVIDAMTGVKLGYGLPPPSDNLSMNGPDYGTCPQVEIWLLHANNAVEWFQNMGYETTRIGNASKATVQSYIQSDTSVMYYELCHGGSRSIHNQCEQDISSSDISSWIQNYSNIGFAFMGSCGGLCDTDENTFATEFRKGANFDSVVVGYCGMDTTDCDDCWPDAIAWQTELFRRMDQGHPIGIAYANANSAYPGCADAGHHCMRIEGDVSLVFGGNTHPNARRSRCGEIYDNQGVSPLKPVKSLVHTRAHHIHCDSLVPTGKSLTISTSNSNPYNEVAFAANSMLKVEGNLSIDNENGREISVVSERDEGKGMKVKSKGEIMIKSGGAIRVYE